MSPTDAELLAWLDESLSPERLAAIETSVRSCDELKQRCARLLAERDAGGFSLGEIWRRHRLTCPDRAVLGAYLLQALADERMSYLRFHLETVGCPACRANLDDLRREGSGEEQTVATTRRRRLFQSSVGTLTRRPG